MNRWEECWAFIVPFDCTGLNLSVFVWGGGGERMGLGGGTRFQLKHSKINIKTVQRWLILLVLSSINSYIFKFQRLSENSHRRILKNRRQMSFHLFHRHVGLSANSRSVGCTVSNCGGGGIFGYHFSFKNCQLKILPVPFFLLPAVLSS